MIKNEIEVLWNDKKMTLSDFSKFVNLPYNVVYKRYNRGWTLFEIANRKLNDRIHNMTGTRLFRIYTNMCTRCYNSNATHYKNYGGRGIKVCDEWLTDKVLFFEWAKSNGYNETLTLDRIDVNGNYEPSNCRWVMPKIQMQNTHNTIQVTIKGETKCLKEWAKIYNINYGTLTNRLFRSGWDLYDALTTPVNTKNTNLYSKREKTYEDRLRKFLAKNHIYTLGIAKQNKKGKYTIGYHQKVFNGGYMCTKGIPDLAITIHGIDIRIECKATNGLLSIHQKRILSQILESGGYGFVMYPENYNDIIEFLTAIIYKDTQKIQAMYNVLLLQTLDKINGKTRSN